MSLLLIILCSFALIVGGLMLIIRSANKFKLTDQQIAKIKQREQEQLNKDKDD